jgi:hypothetical protein
VMGLYLLFVAAGWVVLAALLSRWLASSIKFTAARWTVALVVFAVLLPLPLVDEIVGKRQFERLCKENAEIKVDRATAVGRTVYLDVRPQFDVPGTWVRVAMQPMHFVDVATRETVVSYNELRASGGMLVRLFAFSEGRAPLLFRGSCVPRDRPASAETFKPYGITYIEPPRTSTGQQK